MRISLGLVALVFLATAIGCQAEPTPAEATVSESSGPLTKVNRKESVDAEDGSSAETVNGDESPARQTEPDDATSPAASADPTNGNGSESQRANTLSKPVPDGKIHRINFDDLKLDMPPDTVFRPELLTDRVKELDGQRIVLKGFIFEGGIFQQTGIREFLFVMNTQCKFGPGGEAFCVIPVTLPEGAETSFTIRPVAVEGLLTVEPYEGPDGNTWSVYRIAGTRVKH
jgi:hypothetical protein